MCYQHNLHERASSTRGVHLHMKLSTVNIFVVIGTSLTVVDIVNKS